MHGTQGSTPKTQPYLSSMNQGEHLNPKLFGIIWRALYPKQKQVMGVPTLLVSSSEPCEVECNAGSQHLGMGFGVATLGFRI